MLSGLLLNSLSSILSYSLYDYSKLLGLGHGKYMGRTNHQQSFIRQSCYTVLVTTLYVAGTTSALHMIGHSSWLPITDTQGIKHSVPPELFYKMIGFSWGCHLISVILTVCFYCTHPANVTVDPSNKTEVWILGVQKNAVSDKGTIQAEEGTLLQTFQENSF